MTEKEFTARANCVVAGFMLGAIVTFVVLVMTLPSDPAYFLRSYKTAVAEEQERHKAELLRHNIALYGERE